MCKINFRKVETPKTLPPVDKSYAIFDDPILFGEKPVPFSFNEGELVSAGVKNELPSFELQLEIPYASNNLEEMMSLEQSHFELSDPQLINTALFEPNFATNGSPDSSEELSFSSDSSSSSSNSFAYSVPQPSAQILTAKPLHAPKKNAAPAPEYVGAPKKKVKTEEKAPAPFSNTKSSPSTVNTPTSISSNKRICSKSIQNPKISDEKRERNRLAAEKYRKKGRDTIVTLERACHQLSAENAQLKEKSQMLEQQVQQLKTILLQYGVGKDLLDAVGL